MSENTILLNHKDGMGILTLNRPEAFNAINNQMIHDIRTAITELHQDPRIGVVVITGAGKAFQSGADINELSRMSPLEFLGWNQALVETFDTLETMRQPVIAAINGFAIGGGLELALSCTILIASDSARLGLPEVKLGILPGAGGTQRLPRLIGRVRAAEMVLTGELIDAKEAYRIGLVNRVVPADQLMSTAEDIARKILKNAPIAVTLAKDAIAVGNELTLRGAIQYAQKNCMTCFSTEDMREGTTAFLQKRHPNFKGR